MKSRWESSTLKVPSDPPYENVRIKYLEVHMTYNHNYNSSQEQFMADKDDKQQQRAVQY